MSITICDKDLCCGCGLCRDACPASAIDLATDEYGFIRPSVDEGRCSDCGACAKVCPANTSKRGSAPRVFAAYAKDSSVRKKSSSGGVFALLAHRMIDRGGVVAAVGYDSGHRPVYKIASSHEEIEELMGSKYAEASPDGIFAKVKALLDGGRKVLFVGNPCRVAALKNYAGNAELLLTADFLCHGVPPAPLFEKFLAECFDGEIEDVSFRDKTLGWQEFSMRVDVKGEAPRVTSQYKDPYLRVFLGNAALRESCYDCRFKGDAYRSDITLGDFWGISSHIPAMNDDGGTSAVIIRSEKGAAAFDEIKDALVLRETSEDVLKESNPALARSSPKPASRDDMLSMLKEGKSFSEIAAKFGRPLPARVILSERVKRTAKIALGKIKK